MPSAAFAGTLPGAERMAPGSDGVKATFLGNTNLLLDDGETRLDACQVEKAHCVDYRWISTSSGASTTTDRMESNRVKNSLLTAASTLFATMLFVGGYEILKSQQYDAWKADYENNGDWYGKLTVPSNNPTLMWEYRPNHQTEKWGAVIATNAHGFRDREQSLARSENRLRLAFVGDSVTLGIAVELEQTFFRRFEELAHQQRPPARVETLGFAVDGYNAIQVMELVRERVLPFRPDKVVYNMCMNDFDLEGASAGKMKYFRKPQSFFLLRIEKLYKRFFEYHDYHYRKNAEPVIAGILELSKILAGQGTELVLVLLPIFPEEGFAHYPIGHMHRELAQKLSTRGIRVIDLLHSPLTQGVSPRAYALDIWHLNAQGHERVASSLIDALL